MGFAILRSLHLFWRVLISFTPFVLLWILGGVVCYPIARKRAWKQLPEVARNLGLTYEQSNYYSELGELSGTIEEHDIIFSPDDGKVNIFFRAAKKIEICTKRPHHRPKKCMPDFETKNRKFNTIFKIRRASLEVSRQIDRAPEFTDSLVRFYTRWMWHLESIYIDERSIICKFSYGQPFFPYIPSSALKPILTDLVELAKTVDKL